MMRRIVLLLTFCLFGIVFYVSAQSSPQIFMQGWYWDYPKTGQSTTGPNSVSFNWSDTLRLKAAALSQAGFTHVWYPPFAGNGNRSGGYDPRDLYIGPAQTSLGTLEQIKSMVNSMTAVGITPVADMVYNHRDGGAAETNPAVKDYATTFASGTSGSCGFKRPFPSDRYRMVIPIGGSAAEGAGVYYIKMRSKGSIFTGAQYMFHATTGQIGGSRWSPAKSPDVDLTTSVDQFQYTAELGRNYLNKIDSNGDEDEFAVTVMANDFNAAGDLLIIQAINYNSEYSDHIPIDIYYAPAGGGNSYNIADYTNPFNSSYKLQFQTYTDFTNMPSGQGGLDWNGFRPHFTSSSPAGWSQSTCLGPEWSMQSMDYFYDYDHNITATKDLLVNWTKWVYDELGSKGLRMDAVKHFEPSFVSTMLNEMQSSGRTPNLVVGEWYGTNRAELKGWIQNVYSGLSPDASNNISVRVFDFALRDALKQALDNGADPRNAYFNSLRFASDGNNLGSGTNIVTFLNNHDFRSSTVSYGDALVHNNPMLGYTWLLTNNQLGLPTVFYPDYYGYPAHNTTYGNDVIGFDYHPQGLKPLKTEIDNLIKVHKSFITGSAGMDLLNNFGGSNTASSPTNYLQSSPNKALIYQLQPGGTVGNKEVIVAINFDSQPLRVDHAIAIRNGIAQNTTFGDVLRKSNHPYAVVDNQNRMYIELPAKSYSVWVQDYAPLSATLTSTTVCAGQSNTLTALVSGGTGPYTYSFSAGATTIPGSSSLASVTAAGPYSVTITDDFGASVVASISSDFLSTPVINSFSTNATAQPFCTAGANRTTLVLSATVTNGASYTILGAGNGGTINSTTWTVNSTTGVVDGSGILTASRKTDALNKGGSYTLIVANAAGTCTATAVSASIAVAYSPAVTLSNSLSGVAASTTICSAAQPVSFSATPSDGLPPYSNYLFEVSPLLSGTGFVSFSSTASNTISGSVISSFTNGTAVQRYRVTVTDANGCVSPASTGAVDYIQTVVTLASPLSPSLLNNPGQLTACVGQPVTISAVCTSGSIFWNTGVTSNTLAINAVGVGSTTYSAVCISEGCSSSALSVTVVGKSLPVVNLIASAAAVCVGSSLTLSAGVSGTEPIVYDFGEGASGSSQLVVMPIVGSNSYSVTVTDANGCTATSTTTVEGNSLPVAQLLPLSATLTCAKPSASLTASGGVSYSFSAEQNGANDQLLINAAGTYSVVVTDNNGCTATAQASVTTATALPNLSVPVINSPDCHTSAFSGNTANGSISVSAIDGSGPYSYSLSGPIQTTSITGSFTGLVAGSYTVSVSDVNGCAAASGEIVVSAPAAITTSVTQLPTAVACAGTSVTLSAAISGGASPYSYSWSDGLTVDQPLAFTLSNGAYPEGLASVTVTDSKGCVQNVNTAATTIYAQPLITGLAVSQTAVCVNTPLAFTANVGGLGGSAYSFTITNGQVSTSASGMSGSLLTASLLASVATSSSYTLTLQADDGGCVAMAETESVSVANPSGITISPNTSLTIMPGNSVSLTASGADSFTWSTGDITETISVTPSETTQYSVVGFKNGCEASASVTVTVGCGQAMTAKAISVSTVLTLGPNNCAVNISGLGTGNSFVITGPGGYVFSNVYRMGNTYEVIANEVTQPGTYTFNAYYTDACGQISSDSRTFIVTGTACK